MTAEQERLDAEARRTANWKRWGPYLSERQWGTVREDYSPEGSCWEFFPHDHARSRAYRWGEDGLFGITDRECRLCFAIALWNTADPFLKERLFGLTNHEGNHGEDVKEQYFYIDSTPTHSYMKALYKYPQPEFPYKLLVEENRRRGRLDPEFELIDTGVFDENRYFDIFMEYAKNSPDDILIRITAINRGPVAATLHLLPTLWFRNAWSWHAAHEANSIKPEIRLKRENLLAATHETLGRFLLAIGTDANGSQPRVLFTDNESNTRRLWNSGPDREFTKDAFHSYVVNKHLDSVNARGTGTKAAPHYILDLPPGGSQTLKLRLYEDPETPADPLGTAFETIFETRIREADEFYSSIGLGKLTAEARAIARQGYAGLLWSKQFYHYIVQD